MPSSIQNESEATDFNCLNLLARLKSVASLPFWTVTSFTKATLIEKTPAAASKIGSWSLLGSNSA
jgi:hypothetical protein